MVKKIQTVLISVYNKEKILPLVSLLNKKNIKIISTGGTEKFLTQHNIPVTSVESITDYPSILGGRVKTLHPKVFAGILQRSNNQDDLVDLRKFSISTIDMLIVDLYPFQETLKQTKNHDEIIEKIDIGGVSLIRAAAKNYKEVLVVSSMEQLESVIELFSETDGEINLNHRLDFAKQAFVRTANYESYISNYFNDTNEEVLPKIFMKNIFSASTLRYGENPHQKGIYYGNYNDVFEQLSGKNISYNNLLDIDSAIHLIEEFSSSKSSNKIESSFGIFKHNNACGFASDVNIINAWEKALAGDPISAFGGVLITNDVINLPVAKLINSLFFEIIIAPNFTSDALELLKSKKNRIILKKKNTNLEEVSFRTVLNGVLCQQKDYITDNDNTRVVTKKNVSESQMQDLIFASKICKHTKSNAIVLVKNKQLIGSGCGQTSRVDALNQAIEKAQKFNFSLEGSVMASDAFFPFADCVELAHEVGVTAVIQPGGSKNDQLSIDYCDKNEMTMLFTETRHFKH